MKVLFLTNLYPYPLNSGGAIHSHTILKALSEMGCDIDLLCFKEKNNDVTEGIKVISSAAFISHKIITADNKLPMILKCFASLFMTEPFVVFKFRSRPMKKEIKRRLLSSNYDIVYIDHFNLGVYYRTIKKYISKNTPIILNEHNCEYTIMKTNYMQEKNLIKKCFLALETFKVKQYEIKLIKKVNFTTVLTEEDYADLKLAMKKDFRHAVIPVGIPKNTIKEVKNVTDGCCLKLLFVGTLTWEPNNHGICWFVKNVMPLLKGKAELKIVGKNPSKELVDLCENNTDVEILGYVDSLDEVYNICDVMIAPIFIGSGQKVKVMEAFSRGCPVISTDFAVKGIPHTDGEDVVIANNEAEFVEAVVKLNKYELRKVISEKCYKNYKSYFSEEVVIESIQNYINNLSEFH